MRAALDQFNQNLERARNLANLAESLSKLTTDAIDVSDILRASLVLSVSALDHFVHEFVRLGMLEVHRSRRHTSEAHLSFKIPMSAVRVAITDTSQDDWLDQAIRDAHSWVSFQHPDRIADAVRLMSTVRLWEEVARVMGMTSKEIKTELKAIVSRRDKIAHEADMDPMNPGHQWPINVVLVTGALEFIEKLAAAISIVA